MQRSKPLPTLDERLRTAFSLVPPCRVCADIGCDHGIFGATLLAENRVETLLAADVSEKALGKARRRMAIHGLEERTIFAVADGLDALDALPQGKTDAVCILGMGGDTLSGILRRGRDRLRGASLVLSAHTMLPTVREAVADIGYELETERVARAEGRLYLLMKAVPASAPVQYSQEQLWLGPCLLRDRPQEWRPWLERQQRLLGGIVDAMKRADDGDERLPMKERELACVVRALNSLQGGGND